MDITFRQIKQSDNLLIARMIKRIFIEFDAPTEGTIFTDPTTNHLFELFQTPNSTCWVAEYNDDIVGSCGIFPTEGLPNGCTELVKFYVSDTVRGKGVGKVLMQKCEQTAIDFGFSQIYIESLPAFNNAVRIYRKHGYKTLHKALGDSGHFGCDIWMLKKLTS